MTQLMKEFCIEIEDTPGALAQVCTTLGVAGINLRAISADHVGKQGFVRLIPDDPKKAAKILDDRGFMYSENTVIVKTFADKPNQLAQVLDKIGAAGLNLDGVYLLQSLNGNAHIVIVPDDVQKTVRVLRS